MRRLILAALLIVASAAPCLAWLGTIDTAPGSAVTVCTSSNEIGSATQYDDDLVLPKDTIRCLRVQSDCAVDGATTVGKLYSKASSGSYAKVCVYSDLGTAGTPDVSDLKLACTSELNDATGWVSANMDATETISPSTYYWVCALLKTADWTTKYTTSGGTVKYKACVGCTDSPPANLDGSWSSDTILWSMHVTLGS